MLESLSIVVAATGLCMLSPGPDMILVLRLAPSHGRRETRSDASGRSATLRAAEGEARWRSGGCVPG